MLKVAVIGCGKQADAHVLAIREVSDCEIVGVCDTDELMAFLQLPSWFADFLRYRLAGR